MNRLREVLAEERQQTQACIEAARDHILSKLYFVLKTFFEKEGQK